MSTLRQPWMKSPVSPQPMPFHSSNLDPPVLSFHLLLLPVAWARFCWNFHLWWVGAQLKPFSTSFASCLLAFWTCLLEEVSSYTTSMQIFQDFVLGSFFPSFDSLLFYATEKKQREKRSSSTSVIIAVDTSLKKGMELLQPTTQYSNYLTMTVQQFICNDDTRRNH